MIGEIQASTDYAEEIYAWRCWNVLNDSFFLYSTIHGGHWKPGLNKAICNKYFNEDQIIVDEGEEQEFGTEKLAALVHPTPVEDCACGYYACWNIEDIPNKNVPTCLTGLVALSGKIIIAEKGVRAEKGRVAAIVTPNNKEYEDLDAYIAVTEEVVKIYKIDALSVEAATDEFEKHLPNEVKIIKRSTQEEVDKELNLQRMSKEGIALPSPSDIAKIQKDVRKYKNI